MWHSDIIDQNYWIGGSYSLHEYLKTQGIHMGWYPSDIDIFTIAEQELNGEGSIEYQLRQWERQLPRAVLRSIVYNQYYDWNHYGFNGFHPPHHENLNSQTHEDFNEAIIAVGTYFVPNAPYPKIQVIIIDYHHFHNVAESFHNFLCRISDIKVFLHYTRSGLMLWYCIDAENLAHLRLTNLCPSRARKYYAREFTIMPNGAPTGATQ